MEQASEPHTNSQPGNEPLQDRLNTGSTQTKRLKELENAALQTSLISRMETESNTDPRNSTDHEPGEGQHSNGLSFNESGALQQNPDSRTEEEESDTNVAKERVQEERTLTDHLNKRLLSSFLEKLNERDLALPGIQRLDCAVADEDSNRASEDW